MLNPELLERLRPLETHHPLLPIGSGSDKKGPMLKRWPTHPGFTIEQLKNHHEAIAVGIRCDNIFCLDYDGRSSLFWAKNHGFCPWDFETWRVGRTTSIDNYKILFQPTQEQIKQLPNNSEGDKYFQFKVRTSDIGKEALEFFFSPGRQVIVAGKHFVSGGQYKWSPGNGPEALIAPPQALWERVIAQVIEHQEKVSIKRSSSNGKDWRRLEACPVCDRSEHQICQIHRDAKTLRCFVGNSYAPPKGLVPGQIIHDNWAYCRDQYVPEIGGDFSIFVKHRPSPLQEIRRWRRG